MFSQDSVRSCPKCGQQLRFPDVGGVLMACPLCGHQFISPFRMGETTTSSGATAKKTTGVPTPPPAQPVTQPQPPLPPEPTLSAMAGATPSQTAAQSPAARALAARVAAIYAKKAS